MKRLFIIAGGLIFTFALLTPRVDAKMREFKLPDGRSLQAEIVDFNGKLGKVKLKLANGKLKTVNPAIFVKEDRKYIKEWASLDGFRNKSFFKVSCSKDMVEKWKENIDRDVSYGGGSSESETVGEVKFEKFAYNLLIENRNDVPLENIKIEYCIFCKQTGKGRWMNGSDWFQKATKGNLATIKLPAKSKKTVTTGSAIIARQEILGDFSTSYEKVGAELEGVWVRITIKTPGGQTATRTVFEPENLEGKYTWPK